MGSCVNDKHCEKLPIYKGEESSFEGARKLSTSLRSWYLFLVWHHVGGIPMTSGGCGSPVVKVSDHGRHVMSWSPVPLKTRRLGQ
ncbi:hypothetical protein TNCV_312551 [Trichonephila clavipes]|nr:hypothetical protein TNCV_312551 [Trichonephila clavipes]